LPQETILFDRCSLERRLMVDMAVGAWFLGVEMLVFGRAAMGERVGVARLRDLIQIRRGGELLLHDAIRLDGEVDCCCNERNCRRSAGVATLVHWRRTPRRGWTRACRGDRWPEFGASAEWHVDCAHSGWRRWPQRAALSWRCWRCCVTGGLCLVYGCVDRDLSQNLTPREKDKLLISWPLWSPGAGWSAAVKLNFPEAVALISDFVVEVRVMGGPCLI